MMNTDEDMPASKRSVSEIEFVLRETKWRRGHEVLRDLARGGADPAEAAKTAVGREPKPGPQAARKR